MPKDDKEMLTSFSVFPAISLGLTILGEILHMWPFLNPTIEVVTFCLHAQCMLGVFCRWHSPVEDMSVRIFCVRVMECMRAQTRPWFTLSSERVLGNGVWTHVNSKKKIPSTRGSEEFWTPDTASCMTVNPTHYWLSYSIPCANFYFVVDGKDWEYQIIMVFSHKITL